MGIKPNSHTIAIKTPYLGNYSPDKDSGRKVEYNVTKSKMQIEEFNHIVERLKDKMYRVAYRVVKDNEEARDVVQDTLVKIWKSKEKIASVDNPDAYCMMIARNMAIDKLRSRKVETSDIDQHYDIQSQQADPEKLSILRDQLKKVRALIDTLPENHKTVLELRDIEGYSYKEISEMTGYSIDKVKVYLHRARIKLREHFKRHTL